MYILKKMMKFMSEGDKDDKFLGFLSLEIVIFLTEWLTLQTDVKVRGHLCN